MLNNTSIKAFDESDLTNIQNLEIIQQDKNDLKQDISKIEKNRFSIMSVTCIQETSNDIMKMSDDDVLSLIEQTL